MEPDIKFEEKLKALFPGKDMTVLYSSKITELRLTDTNVLRYDQLKQLHNHRSITTISFSNREISILMNAPNDIETKPRQSLVKDFFPRFWNEVNRQQLTLQHEIKMLADALQLDVATVRIDEAMYRTGLIGIETWEDAGRIVGELDAGRVAHVRYEDDVYLEHPQEMPDTKIAVVFETLDIKNNQQA